MKSFIVTIEEFFKMDTNIAENNFDPAKRKLIIPLYQREYKWSNEKIVSLINDIARRDKFIGNIILDEQENSYEVVDGQQRITTCFLTLLCLYNYYSGSPREQESVLRLLKPYGSFLLENYSIGSFVTQENDHLLLTISDALDVYYQKQDFERAYGVITEHLSNMADQGTLREFKGKLLDSEMLVLINDQHRNTSPIEQIFLDINEKAQLLEVEDIFKGHCFENYDDAHHQDLRSTWVELKKQGMQFTKFGFENLSQFIYLYLLEVDSIDIPEKLTIAGKHYLDGKNMDATEALLKDMITYGQATTSVYESINTDDYRFVDICSNSYEYRNTQDHKLLKTMLKEILNAKAQYQKLPLFYLIYSFKTNADLPARITHAQFRSLITNLYIFATLFTYTPGKKSKRDVDHTLRNALRASDPSVADILHAAKELRKSKVEAFEFTATRAGFEWLSFAYSVIDFYSSNQNWLCTKYQRTDGFNLEHFLIPDIRTKCVTWVDGDNSFELRLRSSLVATYKKYAINYLVINEELNGLLLHNDIVDKIEKITQWYTQRGEALPKHVEIIINNILHMPEYIRLSHLKGQGLPQQEITDNYNNFLEAYFREENSCTLLNRIAQEFKDAFSN